MLKAQLNVCPGQVRDQLELRLAHLAVLKSQLEGRDEVALTVKLHLLNQPGRFLVSRLLDPHCLGYKWPFGGLVFTFTVINEIKEEEVNPDHIYLEDAIIVGAGWDSERFCLRQDTSNRNLGKIRGVPTDKKLFSVPEQNILVPVYSSKHSGELLRLPLGIGDQPRDFWERRNIYVRIE